MPSNTGLLHALRHLKYPFLCLPNSYMKSKITRFIQQQKRKKATQWYVIHSKARVLGRFGQVGPVQAGLTERLSGWVQFDLGLEEVGRTMCKSEQSKERATAMPCGLEVGKNPKLGKDTK